MKIDKLKTKYLKSNVWMLHRIQTPHNNISKIYKERGMVHSINELISLIDEALKSGYKIGSLMDAMLNKKVIHLTFDDGYKEHLYVAKELKKRYDLHYYDITFSINIRNSFYKNKLSMDIVYQMINNKKEELLAEILNLDSKTMTLSEIKKILFSSKDFIEVINRYVEMEEYFLNEKEVKSLSKLFSIASHCVNHCCLTALSLNDIFQELFDSKKILSSVLGIKIDTICFPDGKHNANINKIAKEVGYQYGLSISSTAVEDINFNINRIIP